MQDCLPLGFAGTIYKEPIVLLDAPPWIDSETGATQNPSALLYSENVGPTTKQNRLTLTLHWP